jgi:hypothetical protein
LAGLAARAPSASARTSPASLRGASP